MANINSYLSRIRSAIYGEEVRSSIHDAIEMINNESTVTNEHVENILQKAQDSLDSIFKAENSINEKVSDIMSKEIHDDILDSSGAPLLDSSDENVLGSAVFVDRHMVDVLSSRVSALENVLNEIVLLSIPQRLSQLEKHSILDDTY